uniref:pre-mRNA cleavage complex 2 protein Pcf11 isoform X3 n=1 Tax=Ciona intestinalis TaxID=7719 RepID=UPI00089DCD71|nr:pre-mRNA cleavage complex 2 protein Pcf11 isoform X3 [Ciona intestinalis]|eukprot:XP_018670290.1 pre-mRNA cleavage complex 2 protein Pcf11 isoform X3 [Ciona intestinalis]
MDDVIEEYSSSLQDLTFNSKPHINMLTILAEENKAHAESVVKVIEAQLYKASEKLPILYLLDSIVKNVGENYTPLFAKNIVNTFRQAFMTGNEKQKMSLYKLRTTWDEYFPLKRLHALDVKIQGIDPNWPVKPLPAHLQDASTNIHVNPKFIKRNDTPVVKPQVTPVVSKPSQSKQVNDVDKIKEQMIRQQKELLDLQQRKLMLELEQTKQELEAKQKEMQSQSIKSEKVPTSRDPRIKQNPAPKIPVGSLRVTVKNKPMQTAPKEHSIAKDQKLKVNGEPHKVPPRPNKASTNLQNKPEPSKIKAAALSKKRSPKNLNKKSKNMISPTERSGAKPKLHQFNKTGMKGLETKPKMHVKETKKLGQPSDENPLEKLLPVPNEQKESDRRKKRTYRNKPPRSPSPPPPKVARRSSSPAPIPRISPDSNVRRDPRQFGKENRRIRSLKEKQPRESSRSSEGSISPRFSPEPDSEDLHRTPGDWNRPPKRIRPPNDEPSHPPINRRKSADPNIQIPQELTLSHQNEILRQADRQLQNGELTHEQHQELLKQLHQLFELQRIRKMEIEEEEDHRRKMNSGNRRGFPPAHMRGGRMNRPPGMMEEDPRFRDHHEPPVHNNRRMAPRGFSRGRGFRGRGRPFQSRPRSPPSPRKIGGPIHDPRLRDEHEKFSPNPGIPNDFHPDQGPHLSPPHHLEEERLKHRSLSPLHSRRDTPPRKGPPKLERKSDDRLKNLRKYAHDEQNIQREINDQQIPISARFPTMQNDRNGEESVHMEKERNLEEPEDYIIANLPKNEPKQQNFEEPEDYIIANLKEEEQTPCEEPEDYIIANIPASAGSYQEDVDQQRRNSDSEQAYMEHRKKLKQSMHGKDIDKEEEEKMEESGSIEKTTSGTDTDADLSSERKKSEELIRSPSLPLKKRRYVSSESPEKKTDDQKDEEATVEKIEAPEAIKDHADSKQEKDKAKDVEQDIVEVKKEDLFERKIEEDEKMKGPEKDAPGHDEKNSSVFVRDDDDDIAPERGHPRFRGPRHPPRGRIPHPRDRLQEKEEARMQRIYEEEKEKLEWEHELHHQLQMERWEEERRREAGPPFRRGRGRGFPRLPPRDRRDGWESPPMDEEDLDIARGSIRRGGPPHRPPVVRGRRFPTHQRDRRRPPLPHDARPPPGYHRGRSPPDRRLPPHPRHPGEPRPPPEWERGHRLPPNEAHFPPDRPFHPEERRLSPPPINERRKLPIEPARDLPPVNQPPPINQINVDRLLSNLLAKGILKKTEPERSSPTPPTVSTPPLVKTEPVTAPSVVATKPVEEPRTISPFDEELMTMDPDANIPIITLNSDLKIRHDEIIKRLFTGIQCSACGLRFTTRQTDLYAEHLDWHYRVNRKDKEGFVQSHRSLYPAAGEWICFEEVVDPEEKAKNPFNEDPVKGEFPGANEENDLTVPLTGRPGEDICKVCKEAFETFYNENDDEWQFANCVKVDDDNFHPSCYEDNYNSSSLITPIKAPLYNPLDSVKEEIPGLDNSPQIKEEPQSEDEKMEESEVPEKSEVFIKTEVQTDFPNDILEDLVNKENEMILNENTEQSQDTEKRQEPVAQDTNSNSMQDNCDVTNTVDDVTTTGDDIGAAIKDALLSDGTSPRQNTTDDVIAPDDVTTDDITASDDVTTDDITAPNDVTTDDITAPNDVTTDDITASNDVTTDDITDAPQTENVKPKDGVINDVPNGDNSHSDVTEKDVKAHDDVTDMDTTSAVVLDNILSENSDNL